MRATVENTPRGEDGFLYLLRHSKTNQAGAARAEDAKPIVGAAARALQAWLDASGIAQGPLFRRIRRGDVLGEPLAAAAVRDIVRQRCELAGLDESYSAHSLRSGFITEAGRQQVPLGDAMVDGPRQRGHGHGLLRRRGGHAEGRPPVRSGGNGAAGRPRDAGDAGAAR